MATVKQTVILCSYLHSILHCPGLSVEGMARTAIRHYMRFLRVSSLQNKQFVESYKQHIVDSAGWAYGEYVSPYTNEPITNNRLKTYIQDVNALIRSTRHFNMVINTFI